MWKTFGVLCVLMLVCALPAHAQITDQPLQWALECVTIPSATDSVQGHVVVDVQMEHRFIQVEARCQDSGVDTPFPTTTFADGRVLHILANLDCHRTHVSVRGGLTAWSNMVSGASMNEVLGLNCEADPDTSDAYSGLVRFRLKIPVRHLP